MFRPLRHVPRFLRALRSAQDPSRPPRRPRQYRSSMPGLGQLEERMVLNAYHVSNLHDSGIGSLRDAVLTANAHPGADTIDFGVTGAITLNTGELNITGDLAVLGPGADKLTISGNNASRIFEVGSDATVKIYGLK